MRVLSLFDGMACGMLAMLEAGVDVERYVAFEIDKYAIRSATHNFPMIEERGDVFKADFTEFRGFDFLVGGSPCTYWSIAKNTGRETEASGMGWELFSQYVRALHEAQPRWFVYENNKSMSNAIRESITKTFGFEPICINSALVSAQNRQRLYWVGRRNEDGTYSKVDVEQPEDRGILLKDVLDGVAKRIPAYGQECKSRPFGANYPNNCGGFEHRMFSLNPNKQQVDMVAEPVCMRYERSEEAKAIRKQYEAGEVQHGFHELCELHPRPDGKTNTLSTVLKDNPICEPVCVAERGRYKADGSIEQHFEAREDGKTNVLTTVQKDNNVCVPVCIGEAPGHNGKYRNGKQASQQYRVYSTNGKSVAICGNGGGMGAKTGLYAIPVEFDGGIPIKAVSAADGKAYTVYEVKDGFITIKGKRYAIKLADGFYIIRKLTVSECKRLQTVPEWYDFSVVSASQAFRQLGNGWTISVISHLIKACLAPAQIKDATFCNKDGEYQWF